MEEYPYIWTGRRRSRVILTNILNGNIIGEFSNPPLFAWLNLQLSSDGNIDFYTMSGPWLLGIFWRQSILMRGPQLCSLPVSVGVNLPGSSPPHNGNRFVPPGIADQATGSMDYSASIQAPDFKVDWDWKDIPLIWCVIVNGSGIETYSSLQL